jgi:hypothetical protein
MKYKSINTCFGGHKYRVYQTLFLRRNRLSCKVCGYKLSCKKFNRIFNEEMIYRAKVAQELELLSKLLGEVQ